MKINSLRFHLMLWVGGFLLTALLLFGVYIYVRMSRILYEEVDEALRLSATQTLGTLDVNNGHIILADNLLENNEDMASLRERGFTVRILNADGDLLGGLGAEWNSSLITNISGKQPTFSTEKNAQGEPDRRVFTLPVMDNDLVVGYIQTSESLEDVQQTLERLQLSLWFGIPFLTLLAAFGGYFLAGRTLKPVAEITKTARRISAEDLSARLNLPDTGDELGELACTFDEMLSRLDDSFRRERQFTSDASHELRTPLAAMQAIIGVTRSKKRNAAEYEKALDDLGEETGRLRSLTEDLLLLVRGETSDSVHREHVDLSSLLEDVADTLTPLAEAKGLGLECHIQQNLTVHSDRNRLIRLFVNIIDNAIKFTDSGTVTIAAEVVGRKNCIAITDTGVGIRKEHLNQIFDRFFRVDTSRSHVQTGTGLGLAIALQIALAEGGDITVSSEKGMGTSFSVTLPAL